MYVYIYICICVCKHISSISASVYNIFTFKPTVLYKL